MIARLKYWARQLKMNTVALYFSARDPRTPTLAKVVAAAVAVYALSPIDLIPDFIPVLGYLDDLIIVPLGVWIAIRLIPPHVLKDALGKATEADKHSISVRYLGGVFVVSVWLGVLGVIIYTLVVE